MTKKELKQQVKDLYNALTSYIETSKNSEKHIKFIIKIAKLSKIIKNDLESREAIREIKKRKLTNKFIQTFDSFDIQEALEINIQEAMEKVKNNNFTTKEKNIIINEFRGCCPGFIKNIDTKLIKTYGEIYKEVSN